MMYELNTVVGLNTRHGKVDCAIAERRMVRKGRNAGKMEYKFAPMEPTSKLIGFWGVGETFITAPSRSYTEEQVRQAVTRHSDKVVEKEEAKFARAEKGREALGDMDWDRTHETGKTSGMNIGTGDKVLVRYSDIGDKWETVAFVNYKNGKVAIVRQRSVFVPDRSVWLEMLQSISRTRNPRDYRYISTSSIIKVEKV